eukprot:scaffold54261_cov60-Phaeocystis_antarctica.AAC.4
MPTRLYAQCAQERPIHLPIAVALQVDVVAERVGAVGDPPPSVLEAERRGRPPARLLERRELVRQPVQVEQLPARFVEQRAKGLVAREAVAAACLGAIAASRTRLEDGTAAWAHDLLHREHEPAQLTPAPLVQTAHPRSWTEDHRVGLQRAQPLLHSLQGAEGEGGRHWIAGPRAARASHILPECIPVPWPLLHRGGLIAATDADEAVLHLGGTVAFAELPPLKSAPRLVVEGPPLPRVGPSLKRNEARRHPFPLAASEEELERG